MVGQSLGLPKENRTGSPVESPMNNCVADLNRDGHLDIVFNPGSLPRAIGAPGPYRLGNTDRFKEARTSGFQLSGPALESSAIADLNKDGFLDLIFPMASVGHSEIWWGSSQGFKPDKVTRIEANGAPMLW